MVSSFCRALKQLCCCLCSDFDVVEDGHYGGTEPIADPALGRNFTQRASPIESAKQKSPALLSPALGRIAHISPRLSPQQTPTAVPSLQAMVSASPLNLPDRAQSSVSKATRITALAILQEANKKQD